MERLASWVWQLVVGATLAEVGEICGGEVKGEGGSPGGGGGGGRCKGRGGGVGDGGEEGEAGGKGGKTALGAEGMVEREALGVAEGLLERGGGGGEGIGGEVGEWR